MQRGTSFGEILKNFKGEPVTTPAYEAVAPSAASADAAAAAKPIELAGDAHNTNRETVVPVEGAKPIDLLGEPHNINTELPAGGKTTPETGT